MQLYTRTTCMWVCVLYTNSPIPTNSFNAVKYFAASFNLHTYPDLDAFSGKRRIFGGKITKNHSIIVLRNNNDKRGEGVAAKIHPIRWCTITGKPHWETDAHTRTHFISQFIINNEKRELTVHRSRWIRDEMWKHEEKSNCVSAGWFLVRFRLRCLAFFSIFSLCVYLSIIRSIYLCVYPSFTFRSLICFAISLFQLFLCCLIDIFPKHDHQKWNSVDGVNDDGWREGVCVVCGWQANDM